MRRAALLLLIGLLDAAAQARAVGTSGEARFPATVSDATLGEFLRVGRVEAAIPRDADAWLRWGGAPVEHQASAVRAVVDALSAARPRISLAAAILTIARVESGWNPYARNPSSTACGIFQFIRATWSSYDDSPDRCFDPQRNAAAGVKHLIGLYETYVAPRVSLAAEVTTGDQRAALAYRLLYALHYHGEVAPVGLAGGSIDSQTASGAGLAHLQGYLSVLKHATTVQSGRRRRNPRTVRRGAVRKVRRSG